MAMKKADVDHAAEEEVDFRLLAKVLRAHGGLIIGACAVSAAMFLSAQWRRPPIFVSQETLKIACPLAQQETIGGYGLATDPFHILNWRMLLLDRSWTIEMLGKHGMGPLIGKLEGRPGVSADVAEEILGKKFKVAEEGEDTLILRLEGSDPSPLQEILDIYRSELQESVEKSFSDNREKAAEKIAAQRDFLSAQLKATADPALKDKLTATIVDMLGRESILRNPKSKFITIVQPPTAPEKRPARVESLRLICVVGLTFLASVFLANLYEGIRARS